METKIIEDKKVWEDFLAKHPESNFLQSWYWGEFQESLGRKIFHIGFYSTPDVQAQNTPGVLRGIMFCYIETSKRGKYLVVPGGPIIEWNNKNLLKNLPVN